MELTKIFTFDSAHFLTNYNGKCEQLHGHTYKLEITIEGDIQENGLILDFLILKKIVNELVIDKIDHINLNDLLDNPSSENLVVWIGGQLKNFKDKIEEGDKRSDLKLKKIKLWETSSSCVTYSDF